MITVDRKKDFATIPFESAGLKSEYSESILAQISQELSGCAATSASKMFAAVIVSADTVVVLATVVAGQ